MKIPSDEIPQADILSDVINTVVCIANGGTTYQDIAEHIGKVERQGRYYRKAAEILGFIQTPTKNHSVLTNSGQLLLKGKGKLTLDSPKLMNAVFRARIFQRLIPYLELNQELGVTRDQIVSFILSVADISGDTMAPRRFSSVVAWLETLGIIVRTDDRFFLAKKRFNQTIPILKFADLREPILPRTSDLSEYRTVQLRTSRAEEFVSTQRDLVAMERADNAHRTLVNLLAKRVKNRGAIPRYNQLIDLAARITNTDYIFEMKSLSSTNISRQIRSGISQLYEYRYLQNLSNAKLVLVVESKPPLKFHWMIDYLERDRNIFLLWDGNDELYGTNHSAKELAFLDVVPS